MAPLPAWYRTVWSTVVSLVAVFGGAAGSLGLVVRKRWARPLLIASLTGLLVQDFGLFVLANAIALAGPAALVIQGSVLLIAIALLFLARTGEKRGWIPGISELQS